MTLRCAAACLALFWAVPLAAQDVYLPSDQVTRPRLVKSTSKPTYTSEAMLRRIKGDKGEVVLQIDVRPDGTVGTVALVKSLTPELDDQAVRVVKGYQYAPGEKDGKPVTVRIEVTLEFSAVSWAAPR